MTEIPAGLLDRLREHGQEHVLVGWDRLPDDRRREFVATLSGIDFEELARLVASAREPSAGRPERFEPLPVSGGVASPEERAVGEATLARGAVAVLMVAGGQGSRLGFDKPKGMYPVGPVSGASLFQIHAEKVVALSRRYGKPVPFLVMTSPATDAPTREFFEANGYFGIDPADIIFFRQGMMPTVCARTGRLLLEGPGRLYFSPNGHGGTLTALAEQGVLATLRERGIEHVFYFQVDNPLVKLCDPGFLGRHVATRSEASSKVVFKTRPEEKVGVFVTTRGRCALIEYSDLPAELARQRDADGALRFRAGNPAIHLFAREFLERITAEGGLPYHAARKAVPYFEPLTGEVIDPGQEPNALKFERFIFDALPRADRWLAVETRREEEFCPLKNASGPDSPETVRAGLGRLFATWLEEAGIPTNGHPVEVSPLFALDADELKQKLPRGFQVTGPTLLR